MKNFPRYRCLYLLFVDSEGKNASDRGSKESIFFRLGSFGSIILLHEKFLQFDWLRAVVLQLNLKYLHVKITNLLRVVV